MQITPSMIGYLLLNNGRKIPRIGLGTYLVHSNDHMYNIMKMAYDSGYRLIDTANFYANENEIGYALKKLKKDCGIKREEFILSTKISEFHMNKKDCLNSVENSLKAMQTDYLDILLIHWPGDNVLARNEVWLTMQDLLDSKKVLSIGVSNFTQKHLINLMSLKECKIIPSINQIEMHPFYVDQPAIDICKAKGIIVEAYCPFKKGDPKLLQDKNIVNLAQKYKKSSAQIIMKWLYSKNVVSLPRSNNEGRIKENVNIFDFDLNAEEISIIDKMNCMDKNDWNPENLP